MSLFSHILWLKFTLSLALCSLQILALLLRKKKHLLNTHILHLTFALVGTVDSDRESSVIPNRVAFKDLLCDLEVRVSIYRNLHSVILHTSFKDLSFLGEQVWRSVACSRLSVVGDERKRARKKMRED